MPELIVGQAGKELTHNQALAVLDQLAQAVVVDKDLAAPPGSPANGSMYIVSASATGAWSGQAGKLAYWLTTVSEWTFITPADGWSVWVTDEAVRYERKAGAWAVVATGGGGASLPVVQTFTGPKTLALADINTYNVSQDATAQTVTLPAQATVGWTANAEIHIERGGSGSVIVAAASGVLINGMTASLFTVGEQYSVATLKRKSENSWSLFASASCAAVVPAGVTARYWRVTVSGNNGSGYVGIGEIFLVSAGVDLDTSGKTYSASSSYSATYGPDKAFDGTINGQVYWMTHAANMPAWIQIDMGSPVSVSSIDIACSTNFGAGDIPSALDLYYSPDGASWTFAASGSGMDSSVWPLGSRKQFPV